MAAGLAFATVALVTSGCNNVSYASDDFNRVVANGWGQALVGGPWLQVKGTRSELSVDGTGGVFAIPAGYYLNAEQIVVLPEASVRDYSGSFDVSFLNNINTINPRYGGVVAYLVARYQNSSANGYYRLGVAWDAHTRRLWLRTQNAAGVGAPGNWTIQSNTGIDPTSDYPAGPPYTYHVMVHISGSTPTAFQSKIWKVGHAQPTAWMLTGTDTGNRGPQVAGLIGVRASNDVQTSANVYPSFVARVRIEALTVSPP